MPDALAVMLLGGNALMLSLSALLYARTRTCAALAQAAANRARFDRASQAFAAAQVEVFDAPVNVLPFGESSKLKLFDPSGARDDAGRA